jgi:predicted ATPase
VGECARGATQSIDRRHVERAIAAVSGFIESVRDRFGDSQRKTLNSTSTCSNEPAASEPRSHGTIVHEITRQERRLQGVPLERHVRAALTRLHDLPYLQTHPLGGLRGKALQSALTDAVQALALDSRDVAARLSVRMGEYYREHAAALAAVASLLGERLAVTPTASMAPTVSTSARAAPLPGRIAAFVGRERDVEEIRRLLAAATRLVTLVGPGGVGKTSITAKSAGCCYAPYPSPRNMTRCFRSKKPDV